MKNHAQRGASVERRTLAAHAARLMAGDGALGFAQAKRMAAKQSGLGGPGSNADLPDNDEIEIELRSYQALYQGDTQRDYVTELRLTAVDLMQALERAIPGARLYLGGGAFKGTAGPNAPLELLGIATDLKQFEFWLLNLGVPYNVSERSHELDQTMRKLPLLSFEWQADAASDSPDLAVRLALYSPRDTSLAVPRTERADVAELLALIAQNEAPDDDFEAMLNKALGKTQACVR